MNVRGEWQCLTPRPKDFSKHYANLIVLCSAYSGVMSHHSQTVSTTELIAEEL